MPIAEYYYPIMRNLAIGPDGSVYAILPRPDTISIIRLNFYKDLIPLIPGAIEPQITLSTTSP